MLSVHSCCSVLSQLELTGQICRGCQKGVLFFFSFCRQTISGKPRLESFYFKWEMHNVEKKPEFLKISGKTAAATTCSVPEGPNFFQFTTFYSEFARSSNICVFCYLTRACMHTEYPLPLPRAVAVVRLRRSWISSAFFCLYDVWLVSKLRERILVVSIALQVLTLHTHCLPSFKLTDRLPAEQQFNCGSS